MQKVNRAAKAALVLVFLVIIAGSVVRTTGSGMGCPDWPKCFGYYIPPVKTDQVVWHANTTYKKGQFILHNDALYKAKQNFTSADVYEADQWEKYTRHDYAIFNPTHTWIEYINRLLGALSGIPVLLMFVFSLFIIRKKPLVTALAAGTLFLLGYVAWLGKLVVDGNLVPNQITQHMFGSMAIVFLLLAVIAVTTGKPRVEVSKTMRIVLFVGFIVLLTQVLLGTQVREQIDEIAKQTANRKTWIDLLDAKVLIHRSGSLLILLIISWLYWRNFSRDYNLFAIKSLFALVLLEIVVGIVLYYIHVPAFAQPIHLLLSTLMFAYWSWAILRTKME